MTPPSSDPDFDRISTFMLENQPEEELTEFIPITSESPESPGEFPSESPPETPSPLSRGEESASPPIRDRIVILGRRRSGKTIYLARLYEQLWNSRTEKIHMRALDGDSHMSLMRILGTLTEGEWPAATGGNTYSSFELNCHGETLPLIMLDYPGEVFRRAFVDGVEASDTRELIDHVDRALGVICLVDPGNVLDGNVEALADDEFGMVQALDRVRRSSDGKDIPISLILTKCDVHARRIKRIGGVRKFVEARMLNILRIAGRLKYFASAAVRATKDGRDRDVPDMRRPAENVVEPLVWCVEQIVINKKKAQLLEARSAQEQQTHRDRMNAMAEEQSSSRRVRNWWIIFIVIATLFAFCIIGSAIWWVAG